MNRRDLLLGLGASFGGGVLATPALAADSSLRIFSRRTPRRPLLIAGSSALAELTAALTAGFTKAHTNIDIVAGAGSSLSSLIAVRRGSIDVAAMSRDLHESEDQKNVHGFLIARTSVDIVVSRDSPLTALTAGQARGIMGGEINDWSQLGQKPAPIQVIAGAPSRRLIEQEILPDDDLGLKSRIFKSPEEAATAASGDPQAIGFVVHREKWEDEIRRLPVDGVDAVRETILSERYPFTQSLYYVVMGDDPQSTGNLFVTYARSAAGQRIVGDLQLIAAA